MPVYDEEKQKDNSGHEGERNTSGINSDEDGSAENGDLSSDAIESAEQAAETPGTTSAEDQEGQAAGVDDSPGLYHAEKYPAEKLSQQLSGKGFLGSRSRKVAVAVALGGSSLLFLIVIIFMIFISSIKSVHVAEVLRNASFARFHILSSRSFNQTIFEAAALGADSGAAPELKKTLVDRARGIDPEKALAQLGEEGKLKWNFANDSKWYNRGPNSLNSISVSDPSSPTGFRDIEVPKKGGIMDWRTTMRERFDFVQQFESTFKSDFKLEGNAFRNSTYEGLRQFAGIKTSRWRQWTRDKLGNNPDKIQADSAEQEFKATTGDDVTAGGEAGQTARQAREKIQGEINKIKNADGTYDITKLSPDLQIQKAAFDRVDQIRGNAADVSKIVAVATIGCIAREFVNGIAQGGKQMELNSQRMGNLAVTAGDQIKTHHVESHQVKQDAMQYGNFTPSASYKNDIHKPLTGNEVVLPKSAYPIQPDYGGVFDFFLGFLNRPLSSFGVGPATLGNIPGLGGIIENIEGATIDKVCSGVLNPFIQGGVALVEIGVAVGTAGTEEAVAQGSYQAALPVITKVFGEQVLKLGATVGVGEVMGHMLAQAAESLSGYNYTGLEQNADRYNKARAGLEVSHANIERAATYGRELNPEETQAVNAEVYAYREKQIKGGDSYDRFFALSNPYSLASQFAVSLPTTLSDTRNSIVGLVGTILNPGKLFGFAASLTQPLFGKAKAQAQAASSNFDPQSGVPVWGYSVGEIEKLQTDPAFSLQAVNDYVTSGGRLDTMEKTYAPCYDITRYLNDVKDDPNCSTTALGTTDALYYRAYKGYYGYALSTLEGLQNVTK